MCKKQGWLSGRATDSWSMERSRVRVPAVAAGEFSSSGDGSVVRATDSWSIERSRVRVPAEVAGYFFLFCSPGSTFCADSYFGIRSTPVLPQ